MTKNICTAYQYWQNELTITYSLSNEIFNEFRGQKKISHFNFILTYNMDENQSIYFYWNSTNTIGLAKLPQPCMIIYITLTALSSFIGITGNILVWPFVLFIPILNLTLEEISDTHNICIYKNSTTNTKHIYSKFGSGWPFG